MKGNDTNLPIRKTEKVYKSLTMWKIFLSLFVALCKSSCTCNPFLTRINVCITNDGYEF